VVVTVVQDWLDGWAGFLSRLSTELTLAVLLLPIVLAIFSRNIALSLGCIISVVAATLVFLAPAHTAVILGTAFYLGSVVASLSAIIARRKISKFDEFAVLQRQVNEGLCETCARVRKAKLLIKREKQKSTCHYASGLIGRRALKAGAGLKLAQTVRTLEIWLGRHTNEVLAFVNAHAVTFRMI
jgi:hypothetical protein